VCACVRACLCCVSRRLPSPRSPPPTPNPVQLQCSSCSESPCVPHRTDSPGAVSCCLSTCFTSSPLPHPPLRPSILSTPPSLPGPPSLTPLCPGPPNLPFCVSSNTRRLPFLPEILASQQNKYKLKHSHNYINTTQTPYLQPTPTRT
jgi:hypothetical protein